MAKRLPCAIHACNNLLYASVFQADDFEDCWRLLPFLHHTGELYGCLNRKMRTIDDIVQTGRLLPFESFDDGYCSTTLEMLLFVCGFATAQHNGQRQLRMFSIKGILQPRSVRHCHCGVDFLLCCSSGIFASFLLCWILGAHCMVKVGEGVKRCRTGGWRTPPCARTSC